MAVTAGTVKELREKTGAGMMDCKRALEQAGGDIEKATAILREKGAAVLSKREAKATTEGTISSYIHTGGKIGVLVELDCETDFVANTGEFKEMARDIAMQVSWSQPEYVTREDIPEDRVEQERAIHKQWALNQGKPETALPKIVEGRMEKFFSTVVLMDQPFIKNEDVTIGDLIKEKAAKLGEKIVVRRFARYRVGETS
ncbi:MAG TPA: translation elongation factor Ts [Armatimonadota bacterium]|nr:translation elongation factor Ts [Armatimonadota bacterium]